MTWNFPSCSVLFADQQLGYTNTNHICMSLITSVAAVVTDAVMDYLPLGTATGRN